MGPTRRRPVHTEHDLAGVIAKLGTLVHKAIYLGPRSNDMDHRSFEALIGMAYHQDVQRTDGVAEPITYPEDVADIIGTSAALAGGYLRTLNKLGLVKGTAQAGYVFNGDMVR